MSKNYFVRFVFCLTIANFWGCADEEKIKVEETELDRGRVFKAFLFIESVLNSPSDSGIPIGVESITNAKLSKEMALNGFPSIENAESAMLGPFSQNLDISYIRLFLFDEFGQKNIGHLKRLPTYWVVVPNEGVVISEGGPDGMTVSTINDFLNKLEEEILTRSDTKEISNLKNQIEFLREL